MNSEKKDKAGSGSFEEDLCRLEEIVGALEAGKLPLDEALRQFEAGVGLVRKCEKTLSDAERKIEVLVRGMDGNIEAQPFDESTAGTESETTSGRKEEPASPRPGAHRKAAARKAEVEEPPPSVPDEEDAGDELF